MKGPALPVKKVKIKNKKILKNWKLKFLPDIFPVLDSIRWWLCKIFEQIKKTTPGRNKILKNACYMYVYRGVCMYVCY